MHKLLARQLRRAFGSDTAVPSDLAPFVSMVDATYRQVDIDREMLERSLELSSNELSERSRRAEAKSMGLLRALPDFVLYLAPDDTVLDVRTPWPEALTCDAYDGIGRPAREIIASDGTLGRQLEGALRLARAEGTVQVVEFRDAWRASDPRDLELRVSPLDQGEALAVVRDISERKAKERELERARDAAEAASKAKDEFLANMSHEIRTPMNAVLGLTQLLLEGELRPRERGYANSMLDAGRSLLSLINDLLDISRIETGVLTLEPMEFSLATTVRETFQLYEPKASAKGLAIALHTADGVPDRVMGDPGRLRQILMCLLDNAVKFTPLGEIALSVECAAGDEVRFAITDTGIGIPQDRMADILEKFTQVDGASTRRHGGTGLGLAISRHLAQLMGGRIELESTLGAGSRFTLCIPLAPASTPPALPSAAAPPAMAGVPVLLVNDDPDSSDRLRLDLESLGTTVTSVATPAAALGALRAASRAGTPFGLCVMNDRSSDLQSEAMARVIKRDPALADTVLAIVVTLGLPGDARRLFDVGFTAYLAPPLHDDDIRDAVATAWRLERVVGERALVTRHSLAEQRTQRGQSESTAASVVAELAAIGGTAHEAPRAMRDAPLVLVVDDNDINRHVAHEMLRRIGCRVMLAEGGEQGIRLAAEHAFDLILMDVQMPVVDGFEAAACIRQGQSGSERRTPIVAVTANAMRGDRQRCLDGGMDDYLAKPVTRAALYDIVQRWVPRAAALPTLDARVRQTPGPVPVQVPVEVRATSPQAPPAASAPPAANEPSALDVRQLRSIVGDDPARVAEFVAMFVNLTSPMIDAYAHAVETRNPDEVRRQAHKLKGSCGSAGAVQLAALGARAERWAQDGDWETLRSSVAEMRTAFARVRALVPTGA